VTSYEPDDRVIVDDEPGRVITSGRDRTVVEMDDGRTIDVPTAAVEPPPIDPDPDVEDGSHEWVKP
jgi:hypothetical protein